MKINARSTDLFLKLNWFELERHCLEYCVMCNVDLKEATHKCNGQTCPSRLEPVYRKKKKYGKEAQWNAKTYSV